MMGESGGVRVFERLFDEGVGAYLGGDFVGAQRQFRNLLARAEASGNSREIADAAYQLGNVLRAVSRYSEAQWMFEYAQRIARTERDPLAIAHCWLGLGNVHRGTSRYADAERCYAKADEAYAALERSWELLDVSVNRALVAYLRGDYEEAEPLLQAALKRYRTAAEDHEPGSDWDQRVAECHLNLANVYREQGSFGLAEESLDAARKFFHERQMFVAEADCLLNLGNVYHETGRSAEATDAWLRARDVYNGCQLYERGADCTVNLGILALESDEWQEAARRFKDAERRYTELGLRQHAADCRHNRGFANLLAGNHQAAKHAIESAQGEYAQHGLKVPPDSVAALAAVYHALGHYGEARSRYAAAGRGFEEAALPVDVARMSMNIAAVVWDDAVEIPDPALRARAALDLAIPALLTTDDVRFQFPSARDRAAWARLMHRDVSFVLGLAHASGDHDVVGDLVEAFASVGWYAVERGNLPSDLVGAQMVSTQLVSKAARGSTTVPGPLLDFDDLSLPLFPTPPLRVLGPDGPRIALSGFARRRPAVSEPLTTW